MNLSSTQLKSRLRVASWTAGAAALTAVWLLVAGLGTAQSQAADAAPQTFAVGSPSFADVVERVSPAVVNISVSKLIRPTPTAGYGGQIPGGQTPFDDFFSRFFDFPGGPGMQQAPRHAEGEGSGFIIDKSGLIATNNHVVEDAEKVTVTLTSGKTLEARVIGTDPRTDLALVQVDADGDLPYVSFGDSDKARVGEWVLAIGNPFGLGGTATAGIISARGRDIQSGPYDDYLQIDAPINAGNSGGPVFNAAGEVIGINTAIFSPNGGNIGIGFAIPSNLARHVLSELEDGGTVSRGWLGVQIQSVDEDLARALGLDGTDGALVAEIVPDGPADKAGIQSGDVITGFAGDPVESARDLGRLVGDRHSGDRVDLKIWRDGRSRELTVNLGNLDNSPAVASLEPTPSKAPAGELGLTLDDLTPANRAELGLDANARGAVVVDVDPESPAARQGIRPGDVIVGVNRRETDTAREVADALAASGKSSGPALVLVRRGDSQRYVALGRA